MRVLCVAAIAIGWATCDNICGAPNIGADVSRAKPEDAGEILAQELLRYMSRLKVRVCVRICEFCV